MRLSWPFRSLLARPRFGNGLRHRLRRDALELDASGDVLFELHLGAEEDAVTADILRGTEVLTRHGLAVVALALQTDGERTEVVEHHATTCEQRLGDEGFDTCQYGHDVTLGDGGGGELAQLYYPDRDYQSATRLFRSELHETRGLWPAMEAVGYKDYTKVLTRSQVKTIVQFLGEP